MNFKISVAAAILCISSISASAQVKGVSKSLFLLSDSLQVAEVISSSGNEYERVGHHGPAVENSHFALRIYFNDSGTIDLYSKVGWGQELPLYHWYPTEEQRADSNAGCDQYLVGNTLGLGGFGLWDGEKLVRLVATEGRVAQVGDTKNGAFAQMISKGVMYKGEKHDICVRIEVQAKNREVTVIASDLGGKKVQFVTGLNFHKGVTFQKGDGYLMNWGIHPGDVVSDPRAVGGAVVYSKKVFPELVDADNMVMLISTPQKQVKTHVLAASSAESEINSFKRFQMYVSDNKMSLFNF